MLEKKEDILLKIKPDWSMIYSAIFIIIVVISLTISLILFLPFLDKISIIIFFVIITFFGVLSALIVRDGLKLRRTTYFITSERILRRINPFIKFWGAKQTSISFKDIAYIVREIETLGFVFKNKKGEIYYDGTEREYYGYPKGFKKLLIYLGKSDQAQQTIDDSINILFKIIPLKKHPYLQYLFLNKNK